MPCTFWHQLALHEAAGKAVSSTMRYYSRCFSANVKQVTFITKCLVEKFSYCQKYLQSRETSQWERSNLQIWSNREPMLPHSLKRVAAQMRCQTQQGDSEPQELHGGHGIIVRGLMSSGRRKMDARFISAGLEVDSRVCQNHRSFLWSTGRKGCVLWCTGPFCVPPKRGTGTIWCIFWDKETRHP